MKPRKTLLTVLQFSEDVWAPPRDDLTREYYPANEPILAMISMVPGWEAKTAMQFGSIPSRMRSSPLANISPSGGFCCPLGVFTE